MNLSKALKEKNKYLKELSLLINKMKISNSCLKENEFKNDMDELYTQYTNTIEEIISLKDRISKVNVYINEKIYRISEYKSIIITLNGISTSQGVVPGSRFGGTSEKVEYKCQWDSNRIEKMVKVYEKKIEEIQEELDKYNYNTEI